VLLLLDRLFSELFASSRDIEVFKPAVCKFIECNRLDKSEAEEVVAIALSSAACISENGSKLFLLPQRLLLSCGLVALNFFYSKSALFR
jgi:hypothetical protein